MSNLETIYTIFRRDARLDDHGFMRASGTLKEAVAEAAMFYEDWPGVELVAWAQGGWSVPWRDQLAQSLAAGRLIEKTPSGWVALGAEKQEEKPVKSIGALLREQMQTELRKGEPTSADQAEPTFLKELRDLVAIQGLDGNWNDDDYTCGLYNGLELALATVEGREPQYRTLTAPVVVQAPASTAKPNPFAAFRSPDCDSGPSDHLNASRHQMAGMSKS